MCHVQYTVDSVSNCGNKQAYKDRCICLSVQNLSNKDSNLTKLNEYLELERKSSHILNGKMVPMWHLEMLHSTTCLYTVQMSGEHSTVLLINVENLINMP